MALPLLKEEDFEASACTDWETIRERRETYGLTAPDETGPARLTALLDMLQLSCVEQDGLVLLTPSSPSPASLVALVSADELFATDDFHEKRLARALAGRMVAATDLFSLKVAMYQDACSSLVGPHAYLYIVDMDNWLEKPENRDLARLLEQDVRGVRKVVCRGRELAGLLANPFGKTHKGFRLPAFDVQRENPLQGHAPMRDFAATVTHPFAYVRDPRCWLDKLNQHPRSRRLTALANVLVRRVMGTDFELGPGAADVIVERCGERSPMSWYALGTGEQYGLAFCVYLALAFDDVTPQSWLGITDVLTYLDMPHYQLALDVLRDFVMATGANVYVRSNKEDYRELATSKLKTAIACVNVRTI